MMFISAFCKICELNTERDIIFILISVDSQGNIKFMFSKKATKIDEIFTVDLTLFST